MSPVGRRAVEGSDDVVRLLADPQRLAMAGRLAIGPRTPAQLGDDCSLSVRDMQRQVQRLVGSGLVRVEGDCLILDTALLRRIAGALPRSGPIRPHLLVGLSPEDAEVASRYFDADRLVEIPVGPVRRRAVLRILIDEFEPGRYYRESEVRRILRKFHPDDAALRRYLVEDGMLCRENSSRTYWRTPGPPPQGTCEPPRSGPR